ncbi:hypothetical protein D1122_21850, partial [Cereibacter sphaeroides]|uniref:hypothetical protein n=1 Tax=Cereibacter sphaeroides TaxID=1063 RepID=UPI000ED8DE4E
FCLTRRLPSRGVAGSLKGFGQAGAVEGGTEAAWFGLLTQPGPCLRGITGALPRDRLSLHTYIE